MVRNKHVFLHFILTIIYTWIRDGKKNRHQGLKTSNYAIYLEAEWEDNRCGDACTGQ